MSETTRVTKKGQATIPKRLREKYDLEPGDEVAWLETEAGLVVRKRTNTAARGMLVPEDTSATERRGVAEGFEERVRRRRDDNYAEE